MELFLLAFASGAVQSIVFIVLIHKSPTWLRKWIFKFGVISDIFFTVVGFNLLGSGNGFLSTLSACFVMIFISVYIHELGPKQLEKELSIKKSVKQRVKEAIIEEYDTFKEELLLNAR